MSRSNDKPKTPRFMLPTEQDAFRDLLSVKGFRFTEITIAPSEETIVPHDLDFVGAGFEYRKTTDGKLIMFHPTGLHHRDIILAKCHKPGYLEVRD